MKFISISKLGIIGIILLNLFLFSFVFSDVFANKKDLPPIYHKLGIDKDDVDFRIGTIHNLTFSGDLYMNNNRIENVSEPEGFSDAATKGYVDYEIQNLQGTIGNKTKLPICTGEGEALRWDGGGWQCSDIDSSNLVEDIDDGLPEPSSCSGGIEVLHWEDGDWDCRELDISDLAQGSGIAPFPPSCDGEFESLVWTNGKWSCQESKVHDVSSLQWGGCGGEPLRAGDYRDACIKLHGVGIEEAICNIDDTLVQDTCRFSSDEEWDITSGSLPQTYCEELMCVLEN